MDDGVEGAGICHLCTCGRGVDWENLQLCLQVAQLLNLIAMGIFQGLLVSL